LKDECTKGLNRLTDGLLEFLSSKGIAKLLKQGVKMKVLLDFDGVMVTTPVWRPVEQLNDGFMRFNDTCAQNLAEILEKTQADIVLTTTHRIHYDDETWCALLRNRGITTNQVTKINGAAKFNELGNRCEEVLEWIANHPKENFVIIDDDKSLRELPDKLKAKWVETDFHSGLTTELKKQALDILFLKR
jgi:hypothetical protein